MPTPIWAAPCAGASFPQNELLGWTLGHTYKCCFQNGPHRHLLGSSTRPGPAGVGRTGAAWAVWLEGEAEATASSLRRSRRGAILLVLTTVPRGEQSALPPADPRAPEWPALTPRSRPLLWSQPPWGGAAQWAHLILTCSANPWHWLGGALPPEPGVLLPAQAPHSPRDAWVLTPPL